MSEITESGKPAFSGVGFTENFQNLVWNSPAVSAEWMRGSYDTFTPYTPTDWSTDGYAEHEALYGGWKAESEICGECFLMKSANGTCMCELM